VQVVKEQIIIPESTMATAARRVDQHPGGGSDPTRDAAQDLIKDTPQDAGWATKASDQLNQAVLGGSANDADSSAITLGANLSTGGKGNGIGGSGQTVDSSPPSVCPAGARDGPQEQLRRRRWQRASDHVFCDASGSMLAVFTQLKLELKRSIDALKPCSPSTLSSIATNSITR